MADERSLQIHIAFNGQQQGEDLPPVRAYLFDRSGKLLRSEPAGKGTVSLPAPRGIDYRLIVGPDLPHDAKQPPADLAAQLIAAHAVAQDISALATQDIIHLALSKYVWFCWWQTCIVVHGTVRKLLNPGSPSPLYATICSGTVQIFQVDLGCTLDRVASFTTFKSILVDRLRGIDVAAERIAKLRGPVPPGPPPEARLVGAARSRLRAGSITAATAQSAAAAAPKRVAPIPAATKAASLAEAATTIAALDLVAFKQYLAVNKIILWPFLCELIPDWWFCWQELGEVPIQSDGSFWAEICFWCPSDFPDLYFEIVQNFGGVEREVYDPQIACSTYYNYDGSQSVDIVVDDPTAVACLPGGTGPDYLYVEVLGITDIDLQNIDGLTTPFTAGTGLVTWFAQPHPVPFGGTLGLNMSFHPDMKNYYYRWSYRFDGETEYTPITATVVHYYQQLVSLSPLVFNKVPVTLGPLTVGSTHNLYRFPDQSLDWVTVDFWSDTFYAFFDTTEGLIDPPGYNPDTVDGMSARKSGMCTLLLEVFDGAGNFVPCNNPLGSLTERDQPGDPAAPGPFTFLLPSGMSYVPAPNGNITDHGRLVFRIRVDNNNTIAELPAVHNISLGQDATPCGFLPFNDVSNVIGIDYVARHHNGYLNWSLDVVRGLCGSAASLSADGNSPPAPVPPGAPASFPNTAGTLLRPLPPCAGCDNGAAFAVNLNCYAWATNGRYTQTQYDSSATIAFALLKS
jgi:hypothetical protein